MRRAHCAELVEVEARSAQPGALLHEQHRQADIERHEQRYQQNQWRQHKDERQRHRHIDHPLEPPVRPAQSLREFGLLDSERGGHISLCVRGAFLTLS